MKKAGLVLVIALATVLSGCGAKTTGTDEKAKDITGSIQKNIENKAQQPLNETTKTSAAGTTQNQTSSKATDGNVKAQNDTINVTYHAQDDINKSGIFFDKSNITMKVGQKLVISPDEYTKKSSYQVVDEDQFSGKYANKEYFDWDESYLQNSIRVHTYKAKKPGKVQLKFTIAHDTDVKGNLEVIIE